jgi:hypothetical protein
MLGFYATSIQKNLRAYAKRRHFLKMRLSALLIQTSWRAFLQRKKYKQVRGFKPHSSFIGVF